MKDLFSKTCLGLIVLLLAVIALRPALAPQPVHAAVQHKYYVQGWQDFTGPLNGDGLNGIENVMNDYATKGWEFVAAIPIESGVSSGGFTKQIVLVSQK